MTITVYYASEYSSAPGVKTFARETAAWLFDAKGKKTKKNTSWERHFCTIEDAEAYIKANKEKDEASRIRTNKRNAAIDLYDALEKIIAGFESDKTILPRDIIAGKMALAMARGEK